MSNKDITLETASDLVKLLQELIKDYRSDTGKAPLGLILGPNEYLKVCFYLTMLRGYDTIEDGLIYASDFQGIPLSLKELPGIDIEIQLTDILRYVKW